MARIASLSEFTVEKAALEAVLSSYGVVLSHLGPNDYGAHFVRDNQVCGRFQAFKGCFSHVDIASAVSRIEALCAKRVGMID
jgi:hypothetical protein